MHSAKNIVAVLGNKDESKNGMEAEGYQIEGNFQPFEKVTFDKDYKKLKAVHNLQKEVVRKNMHKAMSPISAISGYLDLMKMFLEKDADMEQIERYRSKINEGVNELGELIEELYDAFEDGGNEVRADRTAFQQADINCRVS